jgi:cytochrome c556
MRTLVVAVATLAVMVGVGVVWSADAPQAKPSDPLMKRKLEQAQKVLGALALNDFETMSLAGQQLIDISKRAEWRVVKTTDYEIFSNSFRGAASDLIQAAKEKNGDAAALAYVAMTMSCVKCHKHVREVQMARLD